MRVYHQYREVPIELCYPSGWRQRGYAVIEAQLPIARLRQQIGLRMSDLPLYHLSQCRKILGHKAKHRRRIFASILSGNE